MLTRSQRFPRRNRVAIALRSTTAAVAVAVALTSCNVYDVHRVAAELGVSVTDDQAAVIADKIVTPEEITPEQAKAIAWTAMVVAQQQAATAMPAGTTAAQWAALRRCESGGNYQATNPSGKYRGAYQMDRDFWRTYGDGSAPTADLASKAAQDAAAYKGYRARGWQPWECAWAARGA